MLRALVVLCAIAAIADAHPAPMPCWARERDIFPAPGETRVPRNTAVWIYGGTPGDYALVHGATRRAVPSHVFEPIRLVRIDLPELAADEPYSIAFDDNVVMSFTTGKTRDRKPPTLDDVRVNAELYSTGGQTVSLSSTSTDAIALAVTIHRGTPATAPIAELVVSPRGFVEDSECGIGVTLVDGQPLCFVARALDIAGNASAPLTRCITPVAQPVDPPGPAYDRGMNWIPAPPEEPTWTVTVLASAGGLVAGVLALVAMGWRARRRYAAADAQIVHAEAVTGAAHALRRRATILALACVAAVVAMWATGVLGRDVRAMITSPAIALFVVAMASVSRSYWAADLLEDPLATVTSDGRRYVFIVRADVFRSWLLASPGALRAALERVVPRATVRPRD